MNSLFLTDYGIVELDQAWLVSKFGPAALADALRRPEFDSPEYAEWRHRQDLMTDAIARDVMPWAKALWDANDDVDGRVYPPKDAA